MSCLLSLFYICFSFFFNDTATTEIYTSDTLFPYTTLFRSVAAGFLEDGQGFTAVANNKGNFGYQQTTDFDYTCTVRIEDGTGSGWVSRNLADASQFDTGSEIRTAIGKAKGSANARALEPGK